MNDERGGVAMSSRDATAPEAPPAGPLFYRRPVPLSAQAHGQWRLKEGDLAFAVGTHAVPLMIGEFAMASRSYPIVFAAEDAAPLALLGLERDNLFVADSRWSEGHYVPAYVRRYPFVFIRTENPQGFALAIDADSDKVEREGEEGVALFHDNEATALTRQALEFCRLFTAEHQATQAFATALRSQGLLTARNADATLPGGRTLSITGFEVVDAEKFAALDEEIVVDWHRKGWLGWVNLHLASLGRFSELLSRQSEREIVRSSSRDESHAHRSP